MRFSRSTSLILLLIASTGSSYELFWPGKNAFLQASAVEVSLADGSSLSFEDDLGREPLLTTFQPSFGYMIKRGLQWVEGGLRRELGIYFDASSAPFSLDSRYWIKTISLLDNPNEEPEEVNYRRYTQSETSIPYPSGNVAFHCDYVDITFGSGSKFSAQNFVTAGFLGRDGYDWCGFTFYNPCRDGAASQDEQVCRLSESGYTCSSSTDQTAPMVPNLYGCGENEVPPIGSDPLLPFAPTFPEPESDLEVTFFGRNTFFSARSAFTSIGDGESLKLDSGSFPLYPDDVDEGGKLGLRESTTGAGYELNFFAPNAGLYSRQTLTFVELYGWHLATVDYVGVGNFQDPDMYAPALHIPPEYRLVHLDYFEITLDPVNAGDPIVKLIAKDVMIGAFLPSMFPADVSETFDVFQPCNTTNLSFSRFVDGRLACLDEASITEAPTNSPTLRGGNTPVPTPESTTGSPTENSQTEEPTSAPSAGARLSAAESLIVVALTSMWFAGFK